MYTEKIRIKTPFLVIIGFTEAFNHKKWDELYGFMLFHGGQKFKISHFELNNDVDGLKLLR